jgi:hypothetical protein
MACIHEINCFRYCLLFDALGILLTNAVLAGFNAFINTESIIAATMLSALFSPAAIVCSITIFGYIISRTDRLMSQEWCLYIFLTVLSMICYIFYEVRLVQIYIQLINDSATIPTLIYMVCYIVPLGSFIITSIIRVIMSELIIHKLRNDTIL